ncbi:hypothetical protein ACKI1I_06720 [Streptomyces turgidiscabies]|uniref:DUF3459 domain-containing protein n=1 Tax=Streptomyces turgidiscabies (strain Car8) TaxID=698760 RepID=L7F0Y4_STRT8|nr:MULTISPECIES: hypothetical protein [Streptomyces]ELP64611.1 hypothetical protein STRTUCAR8_09180 [Streptomyces turgidiscabies Car8]MDX3491511.1 hypothetical protein [Streptomyces turgidiscabies]
MSLALVDAPAGVFPFRRDPGFLCAVNLQDEPYRLPEHTPNLLAGVPMTDGPLEPDHATWLQV